MKVVKLSDLVGDLQMYLCVKSMEKVRLAKYDLG